jgi:transposase
MTERTFRPYDRDQQLLLPPSLKDWLPAGHLVYFVADLTENLDLSAILASYGGAARGTVPYAPKLLTAILLYGYCSGVFSSRRIARKLEEDVAFRVVAADQRPDFRTISDFRKAHLRALSELFVQVLQMCQKAGLVKLGHVALDGTKIKANASKHKAMSYARMNKEEERLKCEVEALLRQADEEDEAEDAEYGDKRGDELPAELAYREGRLKKIREAKEALEREAREEAEAKKAEREAREKEGPVRGRKPQEPDPNPAPEAQKNFTDPESRIMPSPSDKKSFMQAYNCQAAVDGKAQIIVAADITQAANDKRQAVPMLNQVVANTGSVPRKLLMDAGYFSGKAVAAVEALGPEVFMPPNRQEHGCTAEAAGRGRIPDAFSPAQRMKRKLRTKRGLAAYGKRKEIAEPVFGQMKQARGFRQFLLRSAAKVKGEWLLLCSTHNILKLWKSGRFKPVYAAS